MRPPDTRPHSRSHPPGAVRQGSGGTGGGVRGRHLAAGAKGRNQRQIAPSNSQLPGLKDVTKAEKGLIWLLVHDPAPALDAIDSLDPADVEGLASSSVLDLARKLNQDKRFSPSTLLERLSTEEARLVTGVASETEAHALDASECARIVRRLRLERERGRCSGSSIGCSSGRTRTASSSRC
jgi:hypothetical protein